ncbi:MAG: glycosyltransferase, partial [Patescibacteria group bacterium]
MRGYPQKISVVIPVYNESDRIQTGLTEISEWHKLQPQWEFILVNDGSTDDTAKQIKKYKFIKLISYPVNQGKGYALKQGVLVATQPLIL